MPTKFIDLEGLRHFLGKAEVLFAGQMTIAGKTITLKSKSGAVLSTITLPTEAYGLASEAANGLMSKEHFSKLEGIAAGATAVANSTINGNIKINGSETPVYDHPKSAAGQLSEGMYKITTDAAGHVIAGTKVVKADITALGIPGQDTTYPLANASKQGLMSSEHFTKLEGIAPGAEVNKLEAVQVNGVALVVSGKAVNIDLSPYAKKTDITSAVRWKGSVQTYSNLPEASQEVGDMYNVEQANPAAGIEAGVNVVWNGKTWDAMAPMIVIESVSTAEIDGLFQ